MSLELYDNPVSANAMKVRFLLAELGLEYERKHVPIDRPRPDWYLDRYPFGTIPFMDDDGYELGEVERDPALPGQPRGPGRSVPADGALRGARGGRSTPAAAIRGDLFPAERIGLMHTDWEGGGGRAR